MRVKNYSDETLTPTDDFTIMDTEENEYRPVPLDAVEPVRLRADRAAPRGGDPAPDSATSGPIQGSLILFGSRPTRCRTVR